eukprot:scaffold34265_cov58-Attheya_sp.AAC.1
MAMKNSKSNGAGHSHFAGSNGRSTLSSAYQFASTGIMAPAPRPRQISKSYSVQSNTSSRHSAPPLKARSTEERFSDTNRGRTPTHTHTGRPVQTRALAKQSRSISVGNFRSKKLTFAEQRDISRIRARAMSEDFENSNHDTSLNKFAILPDTGRDWTANPSYTFIMTAKEKTGKLLTHGTEAEKRLKERANKPLLTEEELRACGVVSHVEGAKVKAGQEALLGIQETNASKTAGRTSVAVHVHSAVTIVPPASSASHRSPMINTVVHNVRASASNGPMKSRSSSMPNKPSPRRDDYTHVKLATISSDLENIPEYHETNRNDIKSLSLSSSVSVSDSGIPYSVRMYAGSQSSMLTTSTMRSNSDDRTSVSLDEKTPSTYAMDGGATPKARRRHSSGFSNQIQARPSMSIRDRILRAATKRVSSSRSTKPHKNSSSFSRWSQKKSQELPKVD